MGNSVWVTKILRAGLICAFALPHPACVAAADLTARDVVRKVSQVYRSARSYEDSGMVIDPFNWAGTAKGPTKKPFMTVFVRPNLFYYQFTEKREGEAERRYVVWADGKKVRSWWSVRPEVQEFELIGPSLSGPLGVSGGSAHTIPRLLLADTMTTTYAITSISVPTISGSETVRGTPCYRIVGRDIGDSPLTLFIGKRDFLVHRIISEQMRGQKKVT